MKRQMLLFSALATALLFGTTESKGKENESAKIIPLDQMWGYELPGTRNIRELEPIPGIRDPAHKEAYLNSSIHKIARYLSTYVPKEGELAESAFAVVGTDKKALEVARAVLNSRSIKEQVRHFPRDTELSLVFFSYVTGWHPKIVSVEQYPDLIKVKYQFVAPEEPSSGGKKVALIPIGRLPEGTVQVVIEQLPPVDYAGRRIMPKRDAERFVCGSFSFYVQ